MKRCDTCSFRNKSEYEKPCIVYREDCKLYEEAEMTRAEAIKILSKCKEKGFKHTFYTLDEYHTAMDMAINSLKVDEMYDLAMENPDALIDRKVIEDIKAKIRAYSEMHYMDGDIIADELLQIIDKHIGGNNNE